MSPNGWFAKVYPMFLWVKLGKSWFCVWLISCSVQLDHFLGFHDSLNVVTEAQSVSLFVWGPRLQSRVGHCLFWHLGNCIQSTVLTGLVSIRYSLWEHYSQKFCKWKYSSFYLSPKCSLFLAHHSDYSNKSKIVMFWWVYWPLDLSKYLWLLLCKSNAFLSSKKYMYIFFLVF